MIKINLGLRLCEYMEPEYMIIRLSLHQVFGLSVLQYTAYYLAYDIGVFGYDFIHSLLQAIYGRYQYLLDRKSVV